MHYKVYTTPEFDRLFGGLAKDNQLEIDKLIKKSCLKIHIKVEPLDLNFSGKKE